LPHRITAADIDIRDDYSSAGYGVVTPGCREALALLARTEGVLLDPVYTGKDMAGLIDDARHGRLGAKDQIVFIHTGGTPALFAYRDELMG
jgi:L-cysteate sulfo-lyase